ncbi:hypothetical protein EXU57_01790 [Segetibacter sp. 3557_3]|uniref:hypothetical protein n=1 Tax=Segetibacter sp. 3557_3 TaxID=2547429 RepID=UPI001058E323|nr:hypothetical protein [Segetibacter sp. 3557_3]TDH28827.1 hypothetical protein EXU57_01790 [Segetibacter sp. 3557_3]
MKHFINGSLRMLKAALPVAIIACSTFAFLSFRVKPAGDFLAQLGIQREQANNKINSGFLAGYLDYYGMRNLKNIAVGDRAAITRDVAAYAKTYVQSEAFKKEYALLKARNKPEPLQKIQTPEELRADMIKRAKETLESSKESQRKATGDTKKIFDQMIEYAQQNLKMAENPENKNIKAYTKNFPAMKQQMEQGYQARIKDWEAKYPDNYMPMIKMRLQEFLKTTENIDFNAALVDKKGVRYFVNPEYERKNNQWKLAFRAGKPAVQAARAFVEEWIKEI